MTVPAAKRSLRRRLGGERRRLAGAASPTARIWAHLAAETAFTDARQVALYAALADEIDTRPIFDVLRRAGRPCMLPRMLSGGRLEFVRVDCWEALVAGRWGVHEPPAEAVAEPLAVDDVVLVPGVAFDECGRRLGRGGGYYDRTFPVGGSTQPLLFGVATEAQIIESVPCDSHDRVMDAIVTERAFRWTWGVGR
jgi:5-formyltetrahydrofolate cyclo-ligase